MNSVKWIAGMLLAAAVVVSCSRERQDLSPPAVAQSVPPADQAPATSVDTSQNQDVGTPEGPHMLGPLSPQPAQLPPDYAVIRLDPNSGTADHCRGNRNPNAPPDPKRDPGPFSANGALTFFGLPVAVTPEDLKAGEVDVAIIGAPIDLGNGYRGAGEGPTAFRAMTRIGGGSMETMVDWRRELRSVDYGNVTIDRHSIERSVPCVMRRVREIADAGAIPIIIGGDHSLEYPDVAGLASKYGKENVGVIHFDSHYDAGSMDAQGHLITHARPVRRLVDDGWILGRNYIQVGLRGAWPGPDLPGFFGPIVTGEQRREDRLVVLRSS